MVRIASVLASAALFCGAGALWAGQSPDSTHLPPRSWIDKDTGHRVHRLSSEPGSSGFYFNVNAYTPDGKLMVYTAPDGIHVLELATKNTRLVVPNPPSAATSDTSPAARMRSGLHTIVVGHKTNSVFFTRLDPVAKANRIYKADLYTGAVTQLAAVPPHASVASINADETLGVGTYDENEADAEREVWRQPPASNPNRERDCCATGGQPRSAGE